MLSTLSIIERIWMEMEDGDGDGDEDEREWDITALAGCLQRQAPRAALVLDLSRDETRFRHGSTTYECHVRHPRTITRHTWGCHALCCRELQLELLSRWSHKLGALPQVVNVRASPFSRKYLKPFTNHLRSSPSPSSSPDSSPSPPAYSIEVIPLFCDIIAHSHHGSPIILNARYS